MSNRATDQGRGGLRLPDRHTYPLLVLLAEEGPLRVGEVARWFRLDKSTVSRHLGRLSVAQLIEPVADPSDARSAPLRVTGAGTAQIAQLNGDLQALRSEQS